MKLKYVSIPIVLFFLIIFLPYRANLYRYLWGKFPSETNNRVYVRKVIDGDTVVLRNRKKVRLIGIDAPELYECDKLYRDAEKSGISPKKIQKMGRESYLFTKRMCEKKYVSLEFDQQKQDKYGRILAYVHLSDGAMLNQVIIKQGYGLAYLKFPFKQHYRESFVQAEKEAKKYERGLWRENPKFGTLK